MGKVSAWGLKYVLTPLFVESVLIGARWSVSDATTVV